MADIEANSSGEVQPPKRKIGARHCQYVLYFLTLVIFFGIYASLSVAIVPMTGKKHTEHLEWSSPDVLLSAFFWANFLPHLTGAKLTDRFKPKWVLLFSMFIGSIFNIVIPEMGTTFGSTGIVACRVIQGLCQGYMLPAINRLIHVWAPISERSGVAHFVFGGTPLGVAACMPLAGVLAGSEESWPQVFYVFGVIGLIWAIIFASFSKHSPDKHRGMREDEKVYIRQTSTISYQTENAENVEDPEVESQQAPTPWLSLVKSLPMWAILLAGSAHCWGSHTLLTQIPTYMSNMLGYDLREDGDLSFWPYFTQLFIGLGLPITEHLIKKKMENTTLMRKVFNSMGLFPPAVALIALAFLDTTQTKTALALLIVAVGTSVMAHSGYLLNILDMAPNNAVVLLSIVNSCTTVPSTLGPLTVGFIGDNKKDPNLWRWVFMIAASLYIACGIFYCVYASAETQPWDSERQPDLVGAIKKFFQEWYTHLKERLNNAWNSTKERFTSSLFYRKLNSAWSSIKNGYLSFKNRVSSAFDALKNCISSFESNLRQLSSKKFCPQWLRDIFTAIGKKLSSLKDRLSSFKDRLPKFTNLRSSLRNNFSSVRERFLLLWERCDISSWFRRLGRNLASVFNKGCNCSNIYDINQ